MEFSKYQKESRITARYPNVGDNLPYLGLGVADEAGEVAGKIKKLQRDHNVNSVAELSKELREELAKEMGDVLWYIAQLSTEIGVDMNDVAQVNLDKLKSRMDRGTLHGDGDNR